LANPFHTAEFSTICPPHKVKQATTVFTLKVLSIANSKRGQNQAKKIRAGKLEARLFFCLNFKGKSSQEEHKTIFSS
jgi:hypothetical protein